MRNENMNIRRGFRQMLIPTIIMAVLALVIAFLAYQKGGTPQLIVGLKGGGNLLLQIVPC
jgi:anti-sigma-K factor RskA